MEQITKRLMNWASILEPSTRAQAERASRMPFIYPHLALMPDAHLGKGATVGSVIPTLGAIMPAAVGVDIGCGMIAVRTQYLADDFAHRDLRPLREAIEKAIPSSAGSYNIDIKPSTATRLVELRQLAKDADFDPASYAANWELQLGTLGSGNHFIEVSIDEENAVWLFLHSGSRGVGNKIATHHIAVAQRQMKRWWITLADPDLAYLVDGTDEFRKYIHELRWAQQFALLNREEMMDRLNFCVAMFMDDEIREQERINCHHNFTQKEHHFGKDVWLSRKGAIEAHCRKTGPHPRLNGHRQLLWLKEKAIDWPCARRRMGRAVTSPARRPANNSRSRICGSL